MLLYSDDCNADSSIIKFRSMEFLVLGKILTVQRHFS